MHREAIKYAFGDLKKSRTRSILGILGVSISVFLLTSVSILTDTISSGFVDYMATDSGNLDLRVSVRRLPTDPRNRTKYFNPYPLMEEIRQNVTGIDKILPRWDDWVNYSRPSDTSLSTHWAKVYAYNSTYENELGWGSYVNELNSSFNFSRQVPLNHCIISPELAEHLRIGPGDNFSITIGKKTGNLTVWTVAYPVLKFEMVYSNRFLMMDLQTLYQWIKPKFTGMVTSLEMTLENAAAYYDIRDLEGSQARILAKAEETQTALGWGYAVDAPKGEVIGFSEYLSIGVSIIFVFIMILSMLIAGILINGLLSTSVEERIREFGIFRTLGAHKAYNILIILYQGTILCLIGTTIGVISAALGIKYVALPIVETYVPEGFFIEGIPFVMTPTTVLLSYAIGIGVSLAVSISPALKVARMKIVDAINPYRHEDTLYNIVKESTVNVKLILFGLLLAVNGGIIFFAIPQLLASLDFGNFAILLIVILTMFLIGLTLAGLGIMPVIQRLVVAIFSPFFKKIINIVKITIHRYQRRNNTTVIMFSISFSFVVFTTGMVRIQQAQIGALQKFNTGSHILVRSEETVWNAPTTEIAPQLMEIEGVEKVSTVLAGSDLLSEIYQGGQKDFGATIGDYIAYSSVDCSLAPVDENYQDTVFAEYFSFTQGTREDAFAKLFNGSNTCIISEAIRDWLSLNNGDRVRITFQRGDEREIAEFTIVGVAGGMPGFRRFKSQRMQADNGGVMISQALYAHYMEVPQPGYVEKVFVKLREEYIGDIAKLSQVSSDIRSTIGDEYGINIRNVERQIANSEDTFATISLLFELILLFTIIICLFGLLASAYSSVLERKREIGIIRTLGLHSQSVGVMFTLESLIVMLSSAITGALIGYLAAYLLSQDMILFTESPSVPLVGHIWGTVVRVFGISFATLLVGMQVILRKVKKANLITIFRETL